MKAVKATAAHQETTMGNTPAHTVTYSQAEHNQQLKRKDYAFWRQLMRSRILYRVAQGDHNQLKDTSQDVDQCC